MVLFLVAMIVLTGVGVLLYRAVAAQTASPATSVDDDAPTGPTRAAGGRARPGRTVAPDDDPDFLRSLDDRIRRSDRDDPPAA